MVKGSGLTAYFLRGEIELVIAGLNVSMRFEGVNPAHQIEAGQTLPGKINFLVGAEPDWRLNLNPYNSVRYRNLYRGIHMVYGGSGRELKSQFEVDAGADPSLIRVRYLGADFPRVDGDGSLVVAVAATELREHAPVAYQIRGGIKHNVGARFLVHSDGTVAFRLDGYDVDRPLVIDPVISYSTLLGGAGTDTATALAVDANGSAYVAGFTDSTNFPVTNPAQSSNGGGNDVFVAKLNPAGNALVYCTYLGGSADDRVSAIAVDGQGSAYITGSTTSRNFPAHAALQPALMGYRNAFVVKLNPPGNSLAYGTYLGGNSSDAGYGIAVDSAGAAYVVGDTTSFSFPATGFQRGTRGGQDAFVTKLSPDGARLVYSTYLGGGGEDHGSAIAVDSGGSAYVTGGTTSTDFPVLNAVRRSNAGGQDAFVTRLSADGTYLLFSTYLGGSGGTVMYPEIGQGIALDPNANAYITGMTSSPDFPLLGPIQTSRQGASDAFVTKFTPSGALVYSTYLGGSSVDVGSAIAVDGAGAAYVAGYTISSDLPVTNAFQNVNAGGYDGFLARLSPAGDVLQFLTYLGGNGSDAVTAVALDPSWNVYLAGYTLSTNFPLRNAFQTSNAGNYGGFAAKLDFSALPSGAVLNVALTHTSNFTQGESGDLYSVTVTNRPASLSSVGPVVVKEVVPSGLILVSMTGVGWICSNGSCTRTDTLAGGASYPPILVTVNVGANAPSSVMNQAIVNGGGSPPAVANDNTLIIANSPPAIATFLKADTTSQGTWKGIYGADGSVIHGDSTTYPSYAQATITADGPALWAPSTTDVRGLQKAGATDRIASAWYGWSNISIDLNLTDGNSHQVALYVVDWDSGGARGERIDVLDAATNSVLDTRSISGFQGGQYLVWSLKGHLTLKVTRTSGANAVVSGMFFGTGPLTGMATFLTADTASQGTWKGVYGQDGSVLQGDSTNYPGYAQAIVTADGPSLWVPSTTDVRGLQKFAATDRIASAWYGWTSISVDLNLTDGITHRVAAYFVDWDSGGGRSERVDLLDAATNSVLDSRSLSNFQGGQYLVWNLKGHLKLRVTRMSGANAVISGLFFGLATSITTATFLKTDSTTQGSWKGMYGSDGSVIHGDSTTYPSYAQATVTADGPSLWAASTTDIRGLQKSVATDRIASAWYGWTSITIDLNLTDGNPHQVALYFVDWDSGGARGERVDVLDPSTNSVLDTRSINGFQGGQYLVWNLKGHVTLKVTRTAGANAVVSGIFFGLAPVTAIATFLKADTATQGTWKGVYGQDGSVIQGDSTNYPAYAQTIVTADGPSLWAPSTADVRGLQKFAATDRIASAWYTWSSIGIDLNLTDGNTHQVAIYFLDWDWGGARAERIDVVDASTNAVLDTRSITGFQAGQYLVWSLKGHVKFKINLVGGVNAVVSGIFFR